MIGQNSCCSVPFILQPDSLMDSVLVPSRLARRRSVASALLLVAAGAACGELPTDPSAHPPLELSVRLDRDTLSLGDSTTVVIVARNPGSTRVTVSRLIPCPLGLLITSGPTGGQIQVDMFLASPASRCADASTSLTLEPGDSVMRTTKIRTVPTHNGSAVPGSYTIIPVIQAARGFLRATMEMGDTLVVR